MDLLKNLCNINILDEISYCCHKSPIYTISNDKYNKQELSNCIFKCIYNMNSKYNLQINHIFTILVDSTHYNRIKEILDCMNIGKIKYCYNVVRVKDLTDCIIVIPNLIVDDREIELKSIFPDGLKIYDELVLSIIKLVESYYLYIAD